MTFWEWLSGGESGSTTIRNLALVVAGLVALVLAWWRSIVADRQAKTAQQSLLNERYQKGATMLGSDVLSVRLAGVYAMQSLAQEYPEHYHVQVMRLFCAFLRLPSRDQSLAGQVAVRPGTFGGIRQDVESVLDAICSRPGTGIVLEQEAEFSLDLRGADLSEIQVIGATLAHAMFHNAKLTNAHFARVDLSKATFSYADLSGSHFYHVDFAGARFDSANLSRAMLQGAEMVEMSLDRADFSEANLGRANLSASTLQDVRLDGARLERADLSGANLLRADLSRAWLHRADLSGAVLLEADLTGARMSEANLSGVVFACGGVQAAKGLTQAQLNQAWANPDNPPSLLGILDVETGEQLRWLGNAP